MVQSGQSPLAPRGFSKHASWLWTPKSNTQPPDFNENSILIAVMGMTGAGKTTFISEATGLKMEIGHDLKSCTKEVEIATTQIHGHEVHLIDTPGFDDTELQDSEVLLKIARYLLDNVRLSGIIYLHPIANRRMSGVATRNLKLFQHLVGKNNMGNVKLVTTMWSDVVPKQGRARLEELVREFWKDMIAAGAKVDRYNDTAEDCKRIIQSILHTTPMTLQFQSEVQGGLRLEETAAGRLVMDRLEEMRKKHDMEIEELREQLANANELRDNVDAIRKEYETKLQAHKKTIEQERKVHEADLQKLKKEIEELKANGNRGGNCIML